MEFTKKLGEALLTTCTADADTKSLAAASTAVAELSNVHMDVPIEGQVLTVFFLLQHEAFAAAAADLIQSNLGTVIPHCESYDRGLKRDFPFGFLF